MYVLYYTFADEQVALFQASEPLSDDNVVYEPGDSSGRVTRGLDKNRDMAHSLFDAVEGIRRVQICGRLIKVCKGRYPFWADVTDTVYGIIAAHLEMRSGIA